MQIRIRSAVLAKERIVAVGLLTQREVELLGQGFSRLWPVDKTPCFQELLQAIDDADAELGKAGCEERRATAGAIPGGGR
jgi:hypothetical protein